MAERKSGGARGKGQRPVQKGPGRSDSAAARIRRRSGPRRRRPAGSPTPTNRPELQSRLRRLRRPAATGATAGAVAAGAAAVPRLRRRTVQPARVGALTPELQAEVARVREAFVRLEGQAQLSDVFDAVGELDTRLAALPLAVDALRQRGYVHSGQLEERIVAFDEHWDTIEPRVEQALRDQVDRLDREMDSVERKVNVLSAAANPASVRTAETAVKGMQSQLAAARRSVQALYEPVQLELAEIDATLAKVDWMLTHLEQSPEIALYEAEGPLAAVEAEWQQDGEEGPDGILYLTDQRLLFEQKEKVARKKFLGLVTTDSETLQDLMLDVPAEEIESIQASKEGGFLGMGKDDILELVLGPNAPVTRVRFHLKGQKSADWAALIRRVQSGEIDGDRADAYTEALTAAEAVQAAFPAQCPNCLADVPPPPRGVSSVICEFCGSTIVPG